jgi:hypothetical protein
MLAHCRKLSDTCLLAQSEQYSTACMHACMHIAVPLMFLVTKL